MSSEPIMAFDKMYDKYCPILYGIAIEISSSEKEVEQILTSTFQIAYSNKLFEKNKHTLCVALIKIMIQTAYEHLKPLNSFRLKRFENMPLLQKFLFDQKTSETLGLEESENRTLAASQIRFEFNTLRNIKETIYLGASVSI